MRRSIPTLFLLLSVILACTVAVAVAEPSSTGYYLPRGYKVKAELYVPDPPFWPGETLGDRVGLSTGDYSVLVEAYASKGGILEGFKVEVGLRVVWIQGGNREVKAKVSTTSGKHTVTMVYGYDGQVKISVDGRLVYGFIATSRKYNIVAEGAKVFQPQPLPSNTQATGEGYNPPSVQDIQLQYLILGGLAVAILLAVVGWATRER